MILSVKTELMKIKTEKTEFGKKQNGIWKKIKRISYGPRAALDKLPPKLPAPWCCPGRSVAPGSPAPSPWRRTAAPLTWSSAQRSASQSAAAAAASPAPHASHGPTHTHICKVV